MTTDSPTEETAREFARWLSGGVAGDMMTGWEDYWTAGIERRDADARAAGRGEMEGALRELLEAVETATGQLVSGHYREQVARDVCVRLDEAFLTARALLLHPAEGPTQ